MCGAFSGQAAEGDLDVVQVRPNFYMIAHNSLSDNFVPPASPAATREHDWLQAHAAAYGVDPEDVYLHFWTDTEVQLEGQNIVVPGWQPGSPKAGATAATRFAARVPVYYRNLTRRIGPTSRAFHSEVSIGSAGRSEGAHSTASPCTFTLSGSIS